MVMFIAGFRTDSSGECAGDRESVLSAVPAVCLRPGTETWEAVCGLFVDFRFG